MRFPLSIAAVLLVGCFQQPAGKVIYAGAPESAGATTAGAHFVVMGQSNAGCHAQRRTVTQTGKVFAEYLGETVPYADPVRGTTTWEWGEGSIWGLVGDALVSSGKYPNVTFTNISRGGSSVEAWSREDWEAMPRFWGDEQPAFDLIDETFLRIQPTAVIWMQGESDRGNDPVAYAYALLNVVRHVRQYTDAPFYVGVATFCGDAGGDEAIRQAQYGIVSANPELNLRHGADTDIAAPLADRMFHADHCHLSWSGQQAAAQAWFEVLKD